MTLPLSGPLKQDCPCGCGRFGVLKFGPLKHVKGCTCRSCAGRRAFKTGHRSEKPAAQKLGLIPKGGRARHHEEHQGGALRYENKTGGAARPVITAFRNVRGQSEASRPYGDHRPFVGTFDYDGLHVGVFDLDHAVQVAVALLEAHGVPLP